MKIRVIFIIAFICVQQILLAQKPSIKDKKTYYLSSIFIGNRKNTLAKDKGHIVFNIAKKTATCFTSCNFIQLKYSQTNENLKFTSIIPAKDPCPDPLVGLENDFKENLPKVSSFTVKGKNLILLNNKDTLMIFREMTENHK